MKISRVALSVTLEAINKKFNHISIYETNTCYIGESNCTFGVNWGCFGTVSPEEANEFARELQKASSVASDLNRLELEADGWESEVLADRDFAKKYVEHINREDISASFVVAEIESVIAMNEGKLF